MADKAKPKKGENFYNNNVGNQLSIQLKPLQANEAACYGQHGSDTKAGQLPQRQSQKEFLMIFCDFEIGFC